jgi:putative oxidoreductase
MFMSKYQEQTYAAARIVFGLLFMLHGSQKIFNVPASEMFGQIPVHIQYGSGGIELVAGAMVMVGFMTGWAAFLSSGLMAVAYWVAHGTKSLFPHTNGGELAVLYCFAFLFISAKGSGIWSVDAAR